MPGEFRPPLDDEIDDVARSLTASPPPAAMRAAVGARIAGRSGSSHAVRWCLGIAAGAAVIVLAIVWPGREAQVDTPVSREALTRVVPQAATDRSRELGSAKPRTIVGRGSPGEPDRVRPTNAEPLPDEPLPSVGPIVVEPLAALDPLGLNGIEIHTLTVEALSLEPLSRQ